MNRLFVLTAAFVLLLACTISSVEARRGSHDERQRETRVDKVDTNEVRFRNVLASGTMKNTVDYRIKVDNSQVSFDVSYKQQDSNTSEAQQNFRIRFDRIAEFVDNNTIAGYQPLSDQNINSFDFGTWNAFSVQGPDANGTRIFTVNTTDQRYFLRVTVGAKPFNVVYANQTLVVTPNNVKFELSMNFTGYSYGSNQSRLALRGKVETRAFSVASAPSEFQSEEVSEAGGSSAPVFHLESDDGTTNGTATSGGSTTNGTATSGGDTANGTSTSGGTSFNGTSDGVVSGGTSSNETSDGVVSGGSATDDSAASGSGSESEGESESEHEIEVDHQENENESENENPNDGRSETERAQDRITGAVLIGNVTDSKAVVGVFDWVPLIIVDGRVGSIISSNASRDCVAENANGTCYSMWFTFNATQPREITWDPSVGFGTAYVDANTGTNNPPSTNTPTSAAAPVFALQGVALFVSLALTLVLFM